ncbi:hypothetical protein D1816_20110 [Aquimarina sp. AD10]|uniref:hypothetical protein n=1 Tax=Aquimarina sp. AD10 TaxID=1714849 RepID=UPI000E5460BB|nr:hypothetical protein [Aquimarina sp. AD10]AXT62566.1 hypothetical protein D1816_20110 [Aquimarina sp. AD10]RKM97750.1 hypothetical protein D7033_13425 [Aquimarina sp. AD10]
MKTKSLRIFKIAYRLVLITTLFLFYNCSQEDDELVPEDLITEEITTNDLDISSKSIPRKGKAWTLYDPRNSIYSSLYQYHPEGSAIRITRISRGYYAITYPGLKYLDNGVHHVVGYKGNHTVQLSHWRSNGNDLIAYVLCYTPSGMAVDGGFIAFVYNRLDSNIANAAYLETIGHFGTTIDTRRSYNSKGRINTITRLAQGVYLVKFPGIIRVGRKTGHIQVTAKGNIHYGSRRFQINWINQGSLGTDLILRAYDATGILRNTDFTISIMDKHMLYEFNKAAYVNFRENNSQSTNNQSNFPTQEHITVVNSTSRSFDVQIPSNGQSAPIIPIALASSFGNDGSYVSIENVRTYPRGATVNVKCYNPDGSLKTTKPKFNVLYYSEIR